MKIKDVMSISCTYVSSQTTISEAAQIMADQDIGFIPVVENDRMIGMVTDRDIVIRCVAKGADAASPVRDAMTAKTYYCFENDDSEKVCENMADLKVRRLPVVNSDKRLVGVVSLGDLAQQCEQSTVGETVQCITDPTGVKKAA